MQTQTQTVAPKLSKKIQYISIAVLAIAAIIGYIGCSVYFKFLSVDEETMGTLFYSWRVEGADDSALKEKADKIPNNPAMAQKIEIFKNNFSQDSYPIHLPRLAVNHTTFAYPNMQLMYGLRKMIVEKQDELIDMKSNKSLYSEFSTKVTPTLFYSKKWMGSSAVEETIRKYHASLDGAHQEMFVSVMNKIISLYVNMVDDESYKFSGKTPSEKAINDLASIIKEFESTDIFVETGVRKEGEFNTLTDYIEKNEDVDIFLKTLNLKRESNKIPETLSAEFFNSIKKGVLYPYFSLGYSTMLNTFFYLCLDMENLEYDKNPTVDVDSSIKEIAEEQKAGANRATAFGSAIALGVAKSMSPGTKIGEETVRNKLNPIVFFLFTPKVATPSANTEENLKAIVGHLKEKQEFIKSL